MAESTNATLFIVAAPSGGGKTSLVKHLISRMPALEISISHTTRVMRPGEQDGVDYFFIDDAQFANMIQNKQFIEYAQVFNHFYGTSVEQIKARLATGIDIILDIDWQGALQIKQQFPEAVSIFIIPPSLEILEERLRSRGQDNDEVIGYRMQKSQDELSHYPEFDYLIINDDFYQAAAELESIVRSVRLKTGRQVKKFAKLLSLLFVSK